MISDADFANALRAWREREKCTQAQAAKYLGVKLRTYQNWEQGRDEPDQTGPVYRVMSLRGKGGK